MEEEEEGLKVLRQMKTANLQAQKASKWASLAKDFIDKAKLD